MTGMLATLKRVTNSLIFRMAALGVVLVLLGLVSRVLVVIPLLQKDVSELVASQQLSIASYVARDIDAKIVARRDLVQSLASDLTPETLTNAPRLAAWLKSRYQLYPLFNSGLMVVRPDGNGLLADYPVLAGRKQLDFRSSDWFQAALAGDGPVISRPSRGRVTGDPLLIMAVAIRDGRGKALAVLAGVTLLHAPGFLDLVNESRLGRGGGFLLVSPRDHLFVASSDPAMVLQPTPPVGVNLLHDKAMAGYRGVGVTHNAKGVEELSAMVSVPSTGWFLVARIPTEEAFMPVRNQSHLILMSGVAITAVVLAALSLFLPWLFHPLRNAARLARRMATGEIEPSPLPIKRDDEVGELVSGFNSLLQRFTDQATALRESEARLAQLALHDALTGLANRTMLEDRLEQALARAERQQCQVALLFCDLDGFKPINDQHGHETGDQVLCQVAKRLQEGRRKSDTVSRIGGDEFVILLPELDNARIAATAVAEEYVKSIARPFVVNGQSLSLGISIGIALYPQSDIPAGHLLTFADTAMYAAKQAGRGRFVFYGEKD